LNIATIKLIIKITTRIAKIIAIPNQSGDNTHIHDQVIYPVSLSTIKTIVNNPVNPIPPDDVVDVFDIYLPPVYVGDIFLNPCHNVKTDYKGLSTVFRQ
jgi:hypothetical protein